MARSRPSYQRQPLQEGFVMATVDKETGEITEDTDAEADAAENEHERAGESLAARFDRDEPDDGDALDIEAEAEREPAPASPTAKQLEAMGKAIDKASTVHETALRRILGDQFEEWMPCPLCMTDGHFAPIPREQRDPDQIAAVHAALGEDGYSELSAATWLVKCETCNGKGQVRTPSDNPDHAVVNCRDCASRGYNEAPLPSVAAVPAWAPPPPPPSPVEWYPVPGGQPDAWGKPAGHPQWGIDLNAVG
jgi:hypothetical protein